MRVRGIDWRLDVRYREKTFAGSVRIEVDEVPDPLVLDSENLTIEESKLDGRPVSLAEDPEHHTLSLKGVGPGSHVLEIRYRGFADPDALVGMYVAPAGPSYVLTTMLFPTGSRRLFPSFEHPAVKTVYRLTVTAEPELRVLFNTAPESTRSIDGRKEWTFAPTPPMSAYLLYLGVGPFDTLTVEGGRCTVTVAASPGRAAGGKFAAERAKEIVSAYEEYYGLPYPLSKLDLIALENFWAGAMENWGAIAYRADGLLLDATTSVLRRRYVLVTLAHEIAHQWFGNLVTNAWWDDFWLNESFATFVAYRTVQHRYPSEEAEKGLLLRWVSQALEMDALRSTHPVHVPVETPEQVGEHADPVTYGKGAAVLRMIESYLGEETFRRGIMEYLRRYQYANARAEDLWNTLGEVARQPVPQIMHEWITRSGYPLVRASWSNGELRLRQERFVQDGEHTPEVWPIPLRIGGPEGERTILLDRAETSLPLASPRGLRLDPGRHAFVRFRPEGALLDQWLEEFPRLDPVDQWGIVSDIGALVVALDVPFGHILSLLDRAALVSDNLPLRALLGLLNDLRMAGKGHAPLEHAARVFLERQLDRIGLDPAATDEPETVAVLREVLVLTRVHFDLPFARLLANRYRDYDALPTSIRTAVMVAYARTGGAQEFEELLRRLRSTDQPGDRRRVIDAMGAFEDVPAFRRALDLAGTPEMPSAEFYVLLTVAARNPAMGATVFDWYRENAGRLTKLWAGTPLMSEVLHLGLVGMGLDREASIRDYFSEHTPPDAVGGARLGLETLALTMRLRRALRDAPST